MFLNEFPDLRWVRHQSKNNFADSRDKYGNKLAVKGWPTVVINTSGNQEERTGIVAPFSLFMNINGASEVTVDGRTTVLKDTYCLVNKGDTYDLKLPDRLTQTFNIHFGDELVRDTVHTLTKSDAQLLEQPTSHDQMIRGVHSHSRWVSTSFKGQVLLLREWYRQQDYKPDPEEENERLYEMLTMLLNQAIDDVKWNTEFARQSTRQEVSRRLAIAIEFMHDSYALPIGLEDISEVSCLSKYHFLRLFKAKFKCTPYQYIKNLKLDRSRHLLENSDLTISEIAFELGFDEPNSFSKAFRNRYNDKPSALRK